MCPLRLWIFSYWADGRWYFLHYYLPHRKSLNSLPSECIIEMKLFTERNYFKTERNVVYFVGAEENAFLSTLWRDITNYDSTPANFIVIISFTITSVLFRDELKRCFDRIFIFLNTFLCLAFLLLLTDDWR
jgi:hypothetical protein